MAPTEGANRGLRALCAANPANLSGKADSGGSPGHQQRVGAVDIQLPPASKLVLAPSLSGDCRVRTL
jgi:hypothetical protein